MALYNPPLYPSMISTASIDLRSGAVTPRRAVIRRHRRRMAALMTLRESRRHGPGPGVTDTASRPLNPAALPREVTAVSRDATGRGDGVTAVTEPPSRRDGWRREV